MAMIDNEHDTVSVRIVYDGPPLAGKTSSLQALQKILQNTGEIYSPSADDTEHTQYFEWLDYTGGVYQGRPIASQIIAAPGQPKLHERRKFLLQTADAVVFVLDSRLDRLSLSLSYFTELLDILAELPEPRPGIIVQANHQDTEFAAQEDYLRFFFEEDMRLFASIATEDKGVRETFVMSVRLALDRLSKLSDMHKLKVGQVEIQNGEQLLEQLHQQALPVTDDSILDKVFSLVKRGA